MGGGANKRRMTELESLLVPAGVSVFIVTQPRAKSATSLPNALVVLTSVAAHAAAL